MKEASPAAISSGFSTKQMGSFRQDEWFRVGEPVEYALMDLRVDLQANTLPGVGAQHREDGLVNAFSLLPGE